MIELPLAAVVWLCVVLFIVGLILGARYFDLLIPGEDDK